MTKCNTVDCGNYDKKSHNGCVDTSLDVNSCRRTKFIIVKPSGGGVSNQSHYADCGIEPIDFIKANNMDFLEGNIIKYVARYKRKNGLEDLNKAQVYLNWLIERETPTA